MDGQDFARLVGLYDRFANALDFDSEDARTAEGEFYTLLGNLYDQERAAQPKLDYAVFPQRRHPAAQTAHQQRRVSLWYSTGLRVWLGCCGAVPWASFLGCCGSGPAKNAGCGLKS